MRDSRDDRYSRSENLERLRLSSQVSGPRHSIQRKLLKQVWDFRGYTPHSAVRSNSKFDQKFPDFRQLRLMPLILLILFVLQVFALPVSGQDLIEQELRITAHGAGKKGLEALMVRPNEPGPHPLALINHGAPRAGSDRRKMRTSAMLPQGRELARRGWTTVLVMRRGYGDSGGSFSEDSHGCGRNLDYYGSGLESANDLRAAIAYLSNLPEVDPARFISTGRPAGGFATVALAANPPAGFAAGISFAGGGSPAASPMWRSGQPAAMWSCEPLR